MFLLNGSMTHCLLAILILIPIGDLCIFGIQYDADRTFKFFGKDIEKSCLISLAIEWIKAFFNYNLFLINMFYQVFL